MDRCAFLLPNPVAIALHFILRSDDDAISVPATIALIVTNPLTVHSFGKLPDGREARLYSLNSARGICADITDYGATVVRLQVPDRVGRFDDVVLGFNRAEDYARSTSYFGAVIGRHCNRIAQGRFNLDGKDYNLATNNSPGGIACHLHGGRVGFDKALWHAEPVSRGDAIGLKLRHLSRDGEEGYPGNLDVTVHYWLQDNDSLRVDYLATTDRPTPVNLTQHSYFNLQGEGIGDILDHYVTIHSRHFTPVDSGLIPTGEIAPVQGTPFDFTSPHAIGERIDAGHPQLEVARGYDHNWVLDMQSGGLALAATVHEPVSGRTMEVLTGETGVQFYSGNFLDGSSVGKRGQPYRFRSGFCLETQHFPDSPNQHGFPSVILRPGQVYRSTTLFKFRAS
jgi:aldose 1-epimerase